MMQNTGRDYLSQPVAPTMNIGSGASGPGTTQRFVGQHEIQTAGYSARSLHTGVAGPAVGRQHQQQSSRPLSSDARRPQTAPSQGYQFSTYRPSDPARIGDHQMLGQQGSSSNLVRKPHTGTPVLINPLGFPDTPDGWKRAFDRKTGRYYLYNRKGETKWETGRDGKRYDATSKSGKMGRKK